MNNTKTLLITVGTTKFENLIKAIDEEDFYKLLDSHKFTKLIIQKGMGEYIPSKFKNLSLANLKVEVEQLMKDFNLVIKESDYIISHAGAGNVLEALQNKKKLFVVVNDSLMDNHQVELAEALNNENYVFYIKNVKNILSDFKNVLDNDKNTLKAYPEFNLDIIPNVIYEMLDI